MLIKIKYYLILLILILPLSLLYIVPEVSASITEKLTNTTFDSDLSSWTTQPGYILNDEFSDTRAAGSVNGTLATDGTNTRTVTDTNSKMSVGGGYLNFATGGFGFQNPIIGYPFIDRTSGKVLTGSINSSSDGAHIGFGTANTNVRNSIVQNGTVLSIRDSTSTEVSVGTVSLGTDYLFSVNSRASGVYYFIKGGSYTNWILLFSSATGTSNLFPVVGAKTTTSIVGVDNVRIPTATWLPTPLAYSTFTTNGATSTETIGPDSQTTPSLSLTGGTVSSGSLSITPTLGSELITNGNMESGFTGGTADNWILNGFGTLSQETSIVNSGSNSQKSVSGGTGGRDGIKQTVTASVGEWLHYIGYGYVEGAADSFSLNLTNTSDSGLFTKTSNSVWTQNLYTTRVTATNPQAAIFETTSGTSETMYFDDLSLKPLTLSSLFSTVPTSDTDVIADTNVTLTSGTQAGLVTNLDSTSSPNNFLIAYHDGTNVKLDKNVGGTYTNLISAATTYSAGATLRVITYHSDASTLKVRVYYNNALVGSEQTVTDAGIISNTIHGMFSTYASNTFDNFTLWARGSDGEYSDAPFEELTATYDTTVKRTGTGSVKLVAGGVDANFLQSVNVETTRPLVFSAYVYTNGSAVTSSDLSLYSDSSVQSTTYTNDGGGWYKLTATITGTNGSTNYGVRVKAGKTVYLDDISLTLNLPDPGPKDSTIVCSDQSPSSAPTITNIVSGLGSSSLTLNFTKANDPVTYYSIEYGTKSGSYQYGASNIGGKDTTNYTVKYLTSGITYYFRIRAGNGCATGPWSTEQKAVVGLPYISNIQSNTQISSKVQTIQKLTNTQNIIITPNPTATSESSQQQDESKILSFISNIKLPDINMPNIEFKLPEISLPKLSFNIPNFDFSLPDISMPDLSFIKNSFNKIGTFGSQIVIYIKDTSTQQKDFVTKVGDWITYSKISFSEIVMDSTPLTISDVKVVKTTDTTAVVTWRTNHLSTSKVNFGTTRDYGNSKELRDKVHDHSVEITGLTPNTKYFYEVMSQNNEYAYDAWHEFVTNK